MKPKDIGAANSGSSGLSRALSRESVERITRGMQTLGPPSKAKPFAIDLPKFDQKVTVRLDCDGMRGLKQLAASEFLDPAIYARQILLKHVAGARPTNGRTEAA